jgi:AcrR family transcriptional regulator
MDARTIPALTAAARQLFYARGVGATAFDDIARESGLTKPTLYRHFPSKDALVAAYLDERNRCLDAELRAWIDPAAPRDRPRAVIDWLCDWISRPGFNGCAFVRAYAELPQNGSVLEKARGRKAKLLATIEEACRAAGVADAHGLALRLALIVEGATTMAFVSGDARPTATAARDLGRLALQAVGLDEA